ncbi:MAG: transposase, partial [Lachnospiraceae bacterium]|nr:transposase [Lachnospiraceae bacterium]
MGRIDTEVKHYMDDNARFAAAFNYYLYGGKQMIDPYGLTALDTTEIAVPYGDGNKVPVQKYRDLLKSWQVKTNGRAIYALLGTELESEVNYAMPVKTGLYDFIHYATQVEAAKKSHRKQKKPLSPGEFLSGFRKEDRLVPIVTLVLFLKDTEWDGPTHLREMFADPEAQLLSFVPDYRINLLAPNRIPKEDFEKFRTDVGPLLEYIKNQKDKEKLDEIIHEN